MKRALKLPAFRRLFAAYSLNELAWAFGSLALAVLVYRRTGSALGADGRIVLLGSVATSKYIEPLTEVFGDRLLFPSAFVGRGDMSRGGLLLRCVRAGTPLDYVPVQGALLHGPRPARLKKVGR